MKDSKAELAKIIGQQINSLLASTGKRQIDLALALGMNGRTANTISYFCKGARIPTYEQLIMIADFFGVSIDSLLRRPEKRTEADTALMVSDYIGLPLNTLSFFHDNKDDEGGPEWKMIRMVEKLIEHPDILSALVAAETQAAAIASSMDTDNSLLPDPWPHEWPEEEKRLHTVQGWETALDAALFNVSNKAVRFAESVLNVRGIREALSKEDRDLQEVLRESEQEG